jgi:hypothetical protein
MLIPLLDWNIYNAPISTAYKTSERSPEKVRQKKYGLLDLHTKEIMKESL